MRGSGLKKVMTVSLLGGVDRFVGGIFGMGKGVFISTLLFMLVAGTLSNSTSFLQRSFFYPFLENSSRLVRSFIEDRELRSRFQPSEPAIPVFEEDPPPGKNEVVSDQKLALDELRYQLAREVGDRPRR